MRSVLALTRAAALSVVLASPLPLVRAAEPAPAPPAEADPLTRFKEASAKAEAAFQAHQYQAAVDAYLEAFGAVPSPDVLYNIAYIYDRHMGKSDLAQDFYRRVIRTPDSSKEIMQLSMKRLAELEAAAKQDGGESGGTKTGGDDGGGTPGDNTAKKTLERDSGPGPGPWVAIGVGSAAVVGGIVAGIMAQGTNDDFKSETDIDAKRALESDGKDQALAADILVFGGGALIVSGVVWYVLASADEPAPPVTAQFELPALRPLVMKDGVGLAWGGKL